MLKYYVLVWLSIATVGSLINTVLWWLDELVLTVPNTDFDHGVEHYIGVFFIGFILSFLISFPSLFFIYLVEEWKKAPFTIWLHVVIFAIHVLALFLFIGLDGYSYFSLLGYVIVGVIVYYFTVFKNKTKSSNTELIDSE